MPGALTVRGRGVASVRGAEMRVIGGGEMPSSELVRSDIHGRRQDAERDDTFLYSPGLFSTIEDRTVCIIVSSVWKVMKDRRCRTRWRVESTPTPYEAPLSAARQFTMLPS
ncbi:hypothetical protein MRB53_038788 [Persea americana]|nr:hypothetical protein MRB53_038788 [Persea americana]